MPTHQFNVKKTNPPPTDVQLAQRIEEYVNLAKAHQATVVALHRTELRYSGDEFNVYRSLRYSNPSPFLYFFEYDDFKLMGSAYESYLKTDNGKATISLLLHVADKHHTDQSLKQLKKAKNERANTMVMEYMRRRLSACGEVSFPVNFLDIEELSTLHLLVATLWVKSQKPSDNFNIIETLRYSPVHYGFSADTATEILNQIETENRGLYGGMLGFINFTGETTHVCIDKAFISRNNRLDYYCETRIDANSDIDDCVQDWKNKQNSPVKIIETAANLL